LARSSFGLTPEAKKYIYEEIFQVVENGNIGYTEAWDLPREIRRWWIARINEENKKKNGPQNTPPPRGPPPWSKREK
jgi:hypothetical protein